MEKTVLIFVVIITSACQAVFLTVEGGVSLVGEHCPGTVRLFCDGVDLPFLRWRYNALVPVNNLVDSEVQTIFPTDANRSPFVVTVSNKNSAFLIIEIVSISNGTINNLAVANFSTILTVDLVQLAKQNITTIICGQLDSLTDSVAVNVSIQRLSFIAPWTLNITNVIATYQSGSLDSVEVQWTKLNPTCPEFKSNVFYEVHLNSFGTIRKKNVNQTSCNSNDCLAIFMEGFVFVGQTSEYEISVRADNFSKVYPISIVDQRQQYFIPDIVTTSCHITAQCKSLSGHTDGECTIMYTTEFTNQTDIGQTHMVSLDTVVLLPYLMPRLVTHYVHFTASLNEGLSVSESIIVEPMLQNLVPDRPDIVSMLGVYSNRGQLEFMEVTWTNLKCENFMGSPVYYILVITDPVGGTLYSTEVYSNECMTTTCTITILATDLTASLSIQLSLAAVNLAGSSLYLPKPQIYQTSAWYYRPQITFINCSALQISCATSTNVHHTKTCVIDYYGEDSLYEKLVSTSMLSSNGTTEILTLQSIKTTTHYLIFRLNVSRMFDIQDHFTYSISDLFACAQDNEGSTSIVGITLGVIFGLLCCAFTLFISVVLILRYFKQVKRNRMEVRADRTTRQEINGPSPLYEEINERPFAKINVKKNEAYADIFN